LYIIFWWSKSINIFNVETAEIEKEDGCRNVKLKYIACNLEEYSI